MTVTTLNPPNPPVTAKSDLERLLDHRICGSYPFNDTRFDAIHVRLSEAYALLSIIEDGCEEGGAFTAANFDIQSRAICGLQRLIAEADFYAERLCDSTKGRGHAEL